MGRYNKSIWIVRVLSLAVMLAAAAPVLAQSWTVIEDEDWCKEAGRGYCEVREITLSSDHDGFGVSSTNGGVKVYLDGDSWVGEGLNLHVTNGGISVVMPKGYSATLDASTTNGGISVDHPIRIQEKSRGRLTGTIGDGGPRIRVRTTNGGVRFLETD
jgi:hypothetical protein